jgi:hypothetical protein
MLNYRKKAMVRMIACVLIITMIIPVGVSAAVEPRASDYLSAYNAYVYLPGDGEVRVYFNVQGTDDMDELGALTIQIYECSTNSSSLNDWEWKTAFAHENNPGMLGYDDFYHSGYVSYQGTPGKYYKAYVCIWAGKNGDGDTRYFWTSAKH